MVHGEGEIGVLEVESEFLVSVTFIVEYFGDFILEYLMVVEMPGLVNAEQW